MAHETAGERFRGWLHGERRADFEQVERREPGAPVEVHEHIDIEEPDVEQPIEVHEHIELTEEERPRTSRDVWADDAFDQTYRRDRVYHDFLATRRERRFGTASLFMLGLTIVATVWALLGGTVAGIPAIGISGIDAPQTLALVSIALLGIGLVLTYGCARGNLLAMGLAWAAGVLGFLVAMGQVGTTAAASMLVPALVGLMALLGLGLVVASTLGMASWRGLRVMRKLLGTPPPA